MSLRFIYCSVSTQIIKIQINGNLSLIDCEARKDQVSRLVMYSNMAVIK